MWFPGMRAKLRLRHPCGKATTHFKMRTLAHSSQGPLQLSGFSYSFLKVIVSPNVFKDIEALSETFFTHYFSLTLKTLIRLLYPRGQEQKPVTYLSYRSQGQMELSPDLQEGKSIFALPTPKCAPNYIQYLFQVVSVTLCCQVLVVKSPMVQPLTFSPLLVSKACLKGSFLSALVDQATLG